MSGTRTRLVNAGPSRGAKVFLGIVFTGVLLMGLSAFYSGLSLFLRPDASNRIGSFTAVILGVVLIILPLWYFYRAHISGPVRATRLERIRRQYPGQPWMERDDWAARRVTHTSGGLAVGLWIWTIGWWGFLSFISWVNYDKIIRAVSESWWNGALMGVFVLAGLIGLSFALRVTIDWIRYGTSVLRIETLPAYAGERFRGIVEARLAAKPRHPLTVELVCEDLEWVTTGRGKERKTRLDVKRLGSARAQVQPGDIVASRDGVRIKIDIAIPPGLPEHSLDEEGNGVHWVVSVTTTGDDPSFSCSFEIPVYQRR
ncbi:MAG: hypothetical protein ACK4MV_20495 [Beijerinckiaceae bacterium]